MSGGLKGWQFDIASALLKGVLEYAPGLGSLSGRFPLSPDGGRPEADFRKGAHDVIALRVAVLDVAPSLRDSPLEPSITKLLGQAAIAGPRLHALARSITLEDRASTRESRAWTWSGMMAAFEASVRETMTEPARCGSELLIDGGYLHDMDDELHVLTELATGMVMAPPLRDHVSDIVRRGSAHEEHVRGSRRWCALCGWLDAINRPTDTQMLYHLGFGSSPVGGPHN